MSCYSSVSYCPVTCGRLGGGVTAESENAQSVQVTTGLARRTPVWWPERRRGCAEARGGIDIYNAVSLYVVL